MQKETLEMLGKNIISRIDQFRTIAQRPLRIPNIFVQQAEYSTQAPWQLYLEALNNKKSSGVVLNLNEANDLKQLKQMAKQHKKDAKNT